ncbi:MAG: pyridoxal 5'-phosphate synthase glutaminase subunit PdxT [Deltaproteobacteria bacterium]|nr:pyridoxal 5'-phosphate synthase glutaminase subunit PdxT [Deltaproteobacteria bacterium]MBW2400921.1 pyridoxal 5'-phosphate synthase glutaminase subunit PdxT [Deltaproteobacteria bacterium]MBW2666707.1 pyridoxal 5'-phosphate synthase glutaminase subunit PdxT [Deltaproteobacteria bacterium]
MAASGAQIGVLAIQGDFEAHVRALEHAGARGVPVRREKDLDGLAGLILPGGESTTIAKGLDRLGLYAPIEAFAQSGRPVFGTCAGTVLLASEVENHPVRSLGLLDATALRNAYGTQVDSFAAEADAGAFAGLRCVFIRAPRLRDLGPGVEVLAEVEGWPVLVREGQLLAATFHPELTDDGRVHRLFLELVQD